jgi:poly-gamma-glutamate synthesis protein (capsule biosynthesis protein)
LKSRVIFRSLALTALAFFLFTFTALADPAPDPTPVPVNATAASISCVAKTLAPGEWFDLSVIKVFPEGETMDEPLLWQTSNANAASISETDGKKTTTVTAKGNGRATISLVGSRSLTVLAKCQVTVRTVKISSMAVSPKSLVIAPGRLSTLSVSVKPSSATYKTVRWVSSKPEVLSFSSARALDTIEVNRGEPVTVYARAEDLSTVTLSATAVSATGVSLKTAYRAVAVRNLSVTKVTLPTSKTLYLEDPNPSAWKFTAAVSPSLVGDELLNAVTYSSSKPEVAEFIDPSTGVLTPRAVGTTYVTASVGGKTSNRCKVTVTSKAIKSLSISTPGGKAVVLNVGETAQLEKNTSPTYAADRRVTWESDNSAVATVTEADGLVTAVSGGVARITVKSVANGRVKATVAVHVRGDGAYKTVTITAAGDAVLGGDQRTKNARNPRSFHEFKEAIFKPGDDGVAGDGTVFTRVAKYFEGENNITTLNLEGTLTLKDTRHDKKPFVFQGDPMWAKTMLRDHNIDAVCIANNHTYDVGKEGYEGTLRALDKSYARVKYYGNGITSYIRTENGVKVAFVGFVAESASASGVIRQVKNAAKNSDMVVAAFHWTGVSEFRYQAPTSRQRSLARAAIGAGADLVLGHHTHRLNRIEGYNGKYIVYDLGNFVTIAKNPLNAFLPDNPRGRFDYDSMIYQQKFHVWTDGFVEAADITIIPCAITSAPKGLQNNGVPLNNAQPMPYTDPEDIARVRELIVSRSENIEVPITFTH